MYIYIYIYPREPIKERILRGNSKAALETSTLICLDAEQFQLTSNLITHVIGHKHAMVSARVMKLTHINQIHTPRQVVINVNTCFLFLITTSHINMSPPSFLSRYEIICKLPVQTVHRIINCFAFTMAFLSHPKTKHTTSTMKYTRINQALHPIAN